MLRTLVISPDSQLVEKVEPTLRQLEFEMDVKPTIPDGTDKLRYLRYCALVVDCAAGKLQQVRETRETWLDPDPVLIAVASPVRNNDELDDAEYVWTQPLLPGEMYRTLLNVRTRATGDRRLRRRQAPHRTTFLRYSYDGQRFFEATIVDVNETGVAIEGVEAPVPGRVLQVEFRLPAMLRPIETLADVVWRGEHGRAGLRFLQMPQQQHQQLERWLRHSRQSVTSYSYAAGY